MPNNPIISYFKKYVSTEPSTSNLKSIHESIQKEGILGKLARRQSHPDIPQFYLYTCERPEGNDQKITSYGYGSGDNKTEAINRAIGEAIEHYCILNEQKELFIQGSYNKLKANAVDPLRFVPFSQAQLAKEKYKKFAVRHKTKLNWLEGYSLTKNKDVLIPASLAYANYSSGKHDEPIIRMPISTGAACHSTLDSALYRGLCEIVERDAYMVSLLPGMKRGLIEIGPEDDLFELKRKVERYNFEVYFLNTSLDTPVISIVCLLIDRTGVGPAVCAGLGSSLDKNEAIKTSVTETVRRHIANRKLFFETEAPTPPEKDTFDWFLWKKQQQWSAPHMIQKAEDIIKGAQKIKYSEIRNQNQPSDKENVKLLVKKLSELGCEVLFVNMTTLEIAKKGLFVVKVISPEMVPLWRDERYPYLGVKRLHEVPKKYGHHAKLNYTTSELINMHPF